MFIQREESMKTILLADDEANFAHSGPQEQTEIIAIIRRGYEQLERFMQKGLMYFNWLASDRIETTNATDLAMLVPRVVDRLPALTAPDVDFQFISSACPCLVRGEEDHLAEVMQILLDNALKFSPAEKVIRVMVQAIGERVTLTVTDRGHGFAPEFEPELFRPFTIADVRHHPGGTGRNLPLASVIVTAYGGQIRAESQGPGQGATFTVEFPLISQSEEEPTKPMSSPSTGWRES